MSCARVESRTESSLPEKKPQACVSKGAILKISLVVFGLLLVGGALTVHFYQVNAIAVYTMGGIGGFLILATAIASIVQCASHRSSKRDKEGHSQAKTTEEQTESKVSRLQQEQSPQKKAEDKRKAPKEEPAAQKEDEQEKTLHSFDIGANKPPSQASTEVIKKTPQLLRHIDYMAAMPVQIIEHAQKRIRFIQIHVFLDNILSTKEPDYFSYIDTLVACMQKLQNFDQNLVFGVAFYFNNESISLDGHEDKLQEFAKLVFFNVINKYISGRKPQDGSQKLYLLSVLYYHIPLDNIAKEWVKKAKPLISLDNIAKSLSSENAAKAERKLSKLMKASGLFQLDGKSLVAAPCNFTPLGRIVEVLDRYTN